MSAAGDATPPDLARLPPYQRTAADLRQKILSGQLRPGERLPAVRSLQQQYTIARATAQAALRVLRTEGLIDIVRGKGTFVADPLPQAAKAMPGERDDACRIEALQDTLRDVLNHIRPQGDPSWELNTCLVSNAQLTKWWAVLGVTPQRQTPTEQARRTAPLPWEGQECSEGGGPVSHQRQTRLQPPRLLLNAGTGGRNRPLPAHPGTWRTVLCRLHVVVPVGSPVPPGRFLVGSRISPGCDRVGACLLTPLPAPAERQRSTSSRRTRTGQIRRNRAHLPVDAVRGCHARQPWHGCGCVQGHRQRSHRGSWRSMGKRERTSPGQRAAREALRRSAAAARLAQAAPRQRAQPSEVVDVAECWDRLDRPARVSVCAPGCRVCPEAEERFHAIRADSIVQRRRFDGPERYPYAAGQHTLHRTGCREIRESVGQITLYESIWLQGALTELAHKGTINSGWATHMKVMDSQEAAAWITERTGPRGGSRYRLCRICTPVLPAAK